MSSHLPAGVTDRDIDALCEHFRKSDHLFDCSRCLREIHGYTGASHNRVNGNDVCGHCIEVCELCGKFFTDEEFPFSKIIIIRYREYESDGKLSEPHCPKCAADWIIGTFLGKVGTWDSDDYSGDDGIGRLEIAHLLAKAFPLPVKEAPDAA